MRSNELPVDLKLPTLSVELIALLDKVFPERCPSISDSDRQIWVAVGQRSVVNYLLSLLEAERESDQTDQTR